MDQNGDGAIYDDNAHGENSGADIGGNENE